MVNRVQSVNRSRGMRQTSIELLLSDLQQAQGIAGRGVADGRADAENARAGATFAPARVSTEMSILNKNSRPVLVFYVRT